MLEQSIIDLDLEPIKIKLMDANEGAGWPQDKAEKIEIQYKQFLDINKRHPDKSIVPNKEIDTFWHYHILDTQKYAEDCDMVFGYFLYHFPYFGMRGEEDAKNLRLAFEETLALVKHEFGEVWVSESMKCSSGSCDGGPACDPIHPYSRKESSQAGTCSQGNCSDSGVTGSGGRMRPSYANMGLTAIPI